MSTPKDYDAKMEQLTKGYSAGMDIIKLGLELSLAYQKDLNQGAIKALLEALSSMDGLIDDIVKTHEDYKQSLATPTDPLEGVVESNIEATNLQDILMEALSNFEDDTPSETVVLKNNVTNSSLDDLINRMAL